jgi:hypothetical protein
MNARTDPEGPSRPEPSEAKVPTEEGRDEAGPTKV